MLSETARTRLAALAPNLTDEPFAPVQVDAYDHTVSTDHIAIDGFCTINQVEQYLQNQAANNATALVAIAGPTGAGRSLAARYVLEKWRALKNLQPGRLLVPNIFQDIEELHYNHFQIFKQWMSLLCEDSLDLQAITPDQYDAIRRAIGNADSDTYATNLRQPAKSCANYLRAHGSSYALLLENIPSADFLVSPKLMFPTAGVLCVCTIKENTRLDPTNKGWIPLKLSSISGPESLDFVSRFWGQHTPNALPFAGQLQTVFTDRKDTVKRVRTLMSQLLINWLETPPGGEPWSFEKAFARAEAGS